MKTFLFLFLLVFLLGCVQIPEEEPMPIAEAEQAPVPAQQNEPVQQSAELVMQNTTPLASLAENKTPPLALLPATTSSPKNQSPGYAWTTEYLTIAEGETKTFYVKK